MSLGQFSSRKQWFGGDMTPAAVAEDLRNLRQELQRGFPGTNTNDNALTGYVGEYIESVVAATNFPATGVYGDFASVSLTAGDWDVTLQGEALINGATWTSCLIGLSSTSGNSATGLVVGSNRAYILFGSSSTTPAALSLTVVPYRISIAATTTYYYKYFAAYSSGGPPTLSGRISARRVR